MGGGRGQFGTGDMRKAATCALKHLAVFQNLGDSIALEGLTRRLFPVIRQKTAAV